MMPDSVFSRATWYTLHRAECALSLVELESQRVEGRQALRDAVYLWQTCDWSPELHERCVGAATAALRDVGLKTEAEGVVLLGRMLLPRAALNLPPGRQRHTPRPGNSH